MQNTLELGHAENVGSGLMPEVINGKVDARSVHESLEIASPFHNWFNRRVEDFGFIQGEDFFDSNLDRKHGSRIDYLITLDMAKELAMVERNEMGRKMRRYFIECEKRLHLSAPQGSPALPTSTLLRLQEINAGVISELGQQHQRIAELERAMIPGGDWIPLLDWLQAHPAEAAQLGIIDDPVWRQKHRQAFAPIGSRCRVLSERAGLPRGHLRNNTQRKRVQTYAPHIIAAAVSQKIAERKGGRPS